MNWKVATVIVIALLVAGAGAVIFWLLTRGETNEAILDRYRTRFEEKRRQLQGLAAKLGPIPGPRVGGAKRPLDPRPVYDVQTKTFNTSILMGEQLLDPDSELRTPERFDLNLFEGMLLTALRWTGPKNPMAESARRERSPTLARELEDILGQPYLVVLRPVHYERPVLLAGNRYTGGKVDLEGFVFDLRTSEIVASVRMSGQSEDVVHGKQGQMDAAIFSSMWVRVRSDLAAELSRATGGVFVFDRR